MYGRSTRPFLLNSFSAKACPLVSNRLSPRQIIWLPWVAGAKVTETPAHRAPKRVRHCLSVHSWTSEGVLCQGRRGDSSRLWQPLLAGLCQSVLKPVHLDMKSWFDCVGVCQGESVLGGEGIQSTSPWRGLWCCWSGNSIRKHGVS